MDSKAIRNLLIRKISTDMLISENIVEAVVSHQFSRAFDVAPFTDSIEVSGFGNFYFHKKKAGHRLRRLLNFEKCRKEDIELFTGSKQQKSIQSLSILMDNINYLKRRLNES